MDQDIEVKRIVDAVAGLRNYCTDSCGALLDKISSQQKIDDSLTAELKTACDSWRKLFA